MQIHSLKPGKKKKRKLIGRGGKKGTYSGKGNKGQKARSGVSIDPLFEGGRSSLVERMKKVRGFKAFRPKAFNVSVSDLEKVFKDGETVDVAALQKSGIVGKIATRQPIKILGSGTLSKKLKIAKSIRVSESAEKAITKAGGSVEKEQKA